MGGDNADISAIVRPVRENLEKIRVTAYRSGRTINDDFSSTGEFACLLKSGTAQEILESRVFQKMVELLQQNGTNHVVESALDLLRKEACQQIFL